MKKMLGTRVCLWLIELLCLALLVLPIAYADKLKNQVMSVHFNHMPVKEALYQLAVIKHKNIVIDPKVAGEVNIKLSRVTWQQICNVLEQEANLQIELKKNILWVSPGQSSHFPNDKYSQRQVSITAKIVNVDQSELRNLGVGFSTVSEEKHKKIALNENRQEGALALPILKLSSARQLELKIQALEESGHAKIVSRPQLVTLNQQPAIIESGEEVPYQEQTSTGNTSVAFKKAVMRLKVTPVILSTKALKLKVEVNQDKLSATVVQGVPAIRTQQLNTQAVLKNGETLLLGGITEKTERRQHEGIWLLSKIPVLGWLFRHKNWQQESRELIILVTPKIL